MARNGNPYDEIVRARSAMDQDCKRRQQDREKTDILGARKRPHCGKKVSRHVLQGVNRTMRTLVGAPPAMR